METLVGQEASKIEIPARKMIVGHSNTQLTIYCDCSLLRGFCSTDCIETRNVKCSCRYVLYLN